MKRVLAVMDFPLINVITRTHNRPNYFKVCTESINQQTYSNIHHIVTYQVEEDLEYINKFGIKNTTTVKVPNIVKDNSLSTYIEGHHLKHAPYNTFLNEAHSFVKEGWVLYLDDDDTFTYSNSVEFLVQHILNNSIDTKHLWRVQFPNYQIPNDIQFNNYKKGKPLEICQISMIGLLYHSKYIDKMKFHEWACGDYFAFRNFDKELPKRNMIDLPLTKLQSLPGCGQAIDF